MPSATGARRTRYAAAVARVLSTLGYSWYTIVLRFNCNHPPPTIPLRGPSPASGQATTPLVGGSSGTLYKTSHCRRRGLRNCQGLSSFGPCEPFSCCRRCTQVGSRCPSTSVHTFLGKPGQDIVITSSSPNGKQAIQQGETEKPLISWSDKSINAMLAPKSARPDISRLL